MIDLEPQHDWVPIQWGEAPEYEPLTFRCRVCGRVEYEGRP